MTIDEAARLLKGDYESADEGEKVVAIHLFGIRHAGELVGVPLKELAARAEIPVTYATEIRKGMNLAKHVEVRN